MDAREARLRGRTGAEAGPEPEPFRSGHRNRQKVGAEAEETGNLRRHESARSEKGRPLIRGFVTDAVPDFNGIEKACMQRSSRGFHTSRLKLLARSRYASLCRLGRFSGHGARYSKDGISLDLGLYIYVCAYVPMYEACTRHVRLAMHDSRVTRVTRPSADNVHDVEGAMRRVGRVFISGTTATCSLVGRRRAAVCLFLITALNKRERFRNWQVSEVRACRCRRAPHFATFHWSRTHDSRRDSIHTDRSHIKHLDMLPLRFFRLDPMSC